MGPFKCYPVRNADGGGGGVSNFPDDTKLFRKGKCGKQHLLDDIDKLIKWSEKMLFNFEKCKCLHVGHGNTGVNYEIPTYLTM